MKLVSPLVGLAALCGVALSGAAASAMPVAIPAQAPQDSNIQQAALVCNGWGHCWHQPGDGYGYGDGYFHPHYDGGWGWHRGWGYGWHRRHHWHPGWRYWHQW